MLREMKKKKMTNSKKGWDKKYTKELNNFTFDQWWKEGRKELKEFIEFLLQQQREEIIRDMKNWTKGKRITKDKVREYLSKIK